MGTVGVFDGVAAMRKKACDMVVGGQECEVICGIYRTLVSLELDSASMYETRTSVWAIELTR